MRLVLALLGLLLLMGCGRPGNNLRWPAHIDSMVGLDDASSTKATSFIDALNTNLGASAVSTGSANGSPITIKIVSSFSATNVAGEHVATHDLKIAGRATVTDDGCLIEIGDFIITNKTQNLFEPVLWHELGHCAGLTHVSQANEIMSVTTISFESYTPEAFGKFLSSFLNSAGLKAFAK